MFIFNIYTDKNMLIKNRVNIFLNSLLNSLTMAQFNFEGDVANISERQLEFINSVILELGFENSKVIFEPVGKAGDNYIASVKRITIDGGDRVLKMIAKIAPILEPIRQAMNTGIMFHNEHMMYTEVLPKLVQLQKAAEIPKEEQLRYAKCYGSLTEKPNEVILLEDLKESDFIMLDRFTPLSSDCVKSVLKNFAILHTLSFVLKRKDEETYDHFKENLLDIWSFIGKADEIKMFFQALEKDTMEILEDKKHIDFLRTKVINTLNAAVKCSKIDSTNKYTVIQQGDSWTNNLMFRFEGDKLKDSVMIDYQVSKNTSPVCDLMYMIFNCTDHETRMKNFFDWIDYYHTELDKSLSNYGLKANFVYPRDRLDADLKQYSKFLFGLSVLLASVLIRKSDDAAKVKDAMQYQDMKEQTPMLLVSSLDKESKTLYKNRVIGLIESFSGLGLL